MRIMLHRIGNSQGVILPKPLLAQLGLTSTEIDLSVERGAIVLRKPKEAVREGWAEASKRIAAAGNDRLVWPEFANESDDTLTW